MHWLIVFWSFSFWNGVNWFFNMHTLLLFWRAVGLNNNLVERETEQGIITLQGTLN